MLSFSKLVALCSRIHLFLLHNIPQMELSISVNALSEDPRHATKILSDLATLSKWRVAANMLIQMCLCRKSINKYHHGSILNAFQKTTKWLRAIHSLWTSVTSGSSQMASTVSCSSVLSSCGNALQWKESLSLLGFMTHSKWRMDPNLVTLNSALSSVVKEGLWREALTVYKRLSRSVQSDIISFNAICSSCEKAAEWREALNVLRVVSSNMISTTRITFSASVSACEKAEQWHWAIQILRTANECGEYIHLHFFNAVISACGKCRQWQPTTRLMEEMALHVVERDTITFNALLYSLESEDLQWKAALGLLSFMTDRKIEKNDITFNAACAASKYKWLAVLGLLYDMKAVQMPNDALTQSSLVTACEEEREQVGAAACVAAVLKDVATSWLTRVRPPVQNGSKTQK